MKKALSLLFALIISRIGLAQFPAFPLSTNGAKIVDSNGKTVKLESINWFGAESGEFVVGGLDYQPMENIVKLIKKTGFNSIRLPFCNELIDRNPVIQEQYLTANPQLKGKTALEIMDILIDLCGKHELMVILDCHRGKGDWCCDYEHGDGLWHTREYSEEVFFKHWRFMVERYKDRKFVVAAELRNEIRKDGILNLSPTWGSGNPDTDWHYAASRCAEMILAVNPNLLIMIGGIDYQCDLSYTVFRPVRLSAGNKLVYVVHDYPWNHNMEQLKDYQQFFASIRPRWHFMLEQNIAPVYISEWGGCLQDHGTGGKRCNEDRYAYPGMMAQYLRNSDASWAYWPLNGTMSSGYNRIRGNIETFGVLDSTWTKPTDKEFWKAVFRK
ncbi:MAG: glycoside hydrolase family 5 protein [Bacteroidales bacterium]|nr:glycoside hydrolase family 5 protein [Bacteroidales bacterium]